MRKHRAKSSAGQGQSGRLGLEVLVGLRPEEAGELILRGDLGGNAALLAAFRLLEKGSRRGWEGWPGIRQARVLACLWWLLWSLKRGRAGGLWTFTGGLERLGAVARKRYGMVCGNRAFERAAAAAARLPLAYAVRYLRNGPAEHRKGRETLWIVAREPRDLISLAAIQRRGEQAVRSLEASGRRPARQVVLGVSAVFRLVGVARFLRDWRPGEWVVGTESGLRGMLSAAVLRAAAFEEKGAPRSVRERDYQGQKRLEAFQKENAARGLRPLTAEEARRRREKRKAELEAEARSQSRNGSSAGPVVETGTPAASSSAGAPGYEVHIDAGEREELKAGRLPESRTVAELALAPMDAWVGPWQSVAGELGSLRRLLERAPAVLIEDVSVRLRRFRRPEEVPDAVKEARRLLGYAA